MRATRAVVFPSLCVRGIVEVDRGGGLLTGAVFRKTGIAVRAYGCA